MTKVNVGAPAPDFELPGTGDRSYRLADHRGRWLVLAFYPGDFTPTCTRQFCSYRDEQDEVAAFDAELLGISPQSVESHERFMRENDLKVALLADESKEVARAYGVLGPGGFVRRAIIIVDPDGIVRHRHVALIGITYQKAGDIARALVDARERARG